MGAAKPYTSHRSNGFHTLRTTFSSIHDLVCGEAHSTCANIRVGRWMALPVALGTCVCKTLAELNDPRHCRGARRGRHLCWRLVTWFGDHDRVFVSAVKPYTSHRRNGSHTLRTTSSSSQTACGEAHSTYANNRVGRSMALPVALGICVFKILAETKGTTPFQKSWG